MARKAEERLDHRIWQSAPRKQLTCVASLVARAHAGQPARRAAAQMGHEV